MSRAPRFTLAQLDSLVASGNIRGYKAVGEAKPAGKRKKKTAPKLPKPTPVGLQHIDCVLKEFGLDYVEELVFHPTRKWRFDRALPAPHHQIGIEFEGIVSEKSRHTTITGYTGDCDKYSEAAILGWRVLRYTALNYKNFRGQLEALLKTI